MKRVLLITSLICSIIPVFAQTQDSLTLQQCLKATDENFPIARQRGLFSQEIDINNKKINTQYLPQLSLNGQATYQSDVISIPIEIPNLNIPTPPNDQFKAYVDVNQIIYDGGAISARKKIEEASSNANLQNVEVQLYEVKGQVNAVYFNILLLREQRDLASLTGKTLKSQHKKLTAAVKNGIMLPSDVDVIKAEIIKNDQQKKALDHRIFAQYQLLGKLTGLQLDSSKALSKPLLVLDLKDTSLENRPESELFQKRKEEIETREKAITATQLPHLSGFAQAGYGRPALNPISEDFESYYLLGLRLNWRFWDWKSSNYDRQLITINQQMIEKQKQAFETNTQAQLISLESEINTLQDQLSADREIIDLRTNILKAATAKLQRGTMTTTDYVTEFNNLQQTKQQYELHQIQMLKAKADFAMAQGNL